MGAIWNPIDPHELHYGLASALPVVEAALQQLEFEQSKGKAMDLNELAARVHAANAKWWHDIETGERIERNKGELLCLIHSEISECLEGVRKNAMDDKLPHRRAEEVELADALIRILDYAGGFGLDLAGAFEEKMAYNRQRADHTHAHRRAKGGKRF